MNDDAPPGTRTEQHRWAVARVVLGNAQMAGAAASVVFLLTTGVTAGTLWTVGITTAVALVSVYLFRVRRYGQQPVGGKGAQWTD